MRSGRVLRVFPDGDRVEQALVDAAEHQPFVDASGYLSFAQLVDECEPARELSRRPCSTLTARVVLWAAAQELPSGPFRAFVQEPAFARAAIELIHDLKAGRCGPADFAAAVDRLPSTRRQRAHFLARLYEAYEQRMAALRLADREDLLRGALSAIRRGMPKALASASAIEIHDLYDFTPLRLDFVLALAQRCQAEGVRFRMELPGSGSPALDGPVDDVLREFERRWQSLEVDVQKSIADRPLSRLSGRLFDPEGRRVEQGQLSAFSAATFRDEARQLAHRARELLDRGEAPEEIAIAFRDLSEEAEAISEALEELGVPARIRLGAPLQATAVGRLALELPLLADDGFPADRVARFLQSRYLPELSIGAPASPASLLAMASVRDDRIGAVAGRGAYQVRLESFAARAERQGRTELARSARALWAKAGRLIEIGSSLPSEANASTLLERWWGCLQTLRLHEAIRKGEGREGEVGAFGHAVARALARDQAAAEALAQLAAELDAALRLSGAGTRPMARRTFHRWLLDAAADFNLDPKGPRGGAVRILDVRQLVGARFRHVLVGGMVDGRFPGRLAPHPLFPEEDRAAVNRALGRPVFRLFSGEVDGRLVWRVAEDRFLFHAVLTAGTETVTLSYARHSSSGQEQLASPFLDELERLGAVAVEDLPLRPVPPLDEVKSESELRERVALEAFGRPELRTTEPDSARAVLAQRFAAEEWYRAAARLTEIEEERLRFFSNPDQPVGPYSGAVMDPSLEEALRETFRFGPDRPASASVLNRFGNCAFQGFLSYALKLEEPELPGEELDGRGRGSFWHSVLERLFPRLREAGLLGRAPEEVPDAMIDGALDEAARELEQRAHVGHPALWRLGRERARAMVRRVLGSEIHGLPFDGHEPVATELPFGKKGAPEGWETVVIPPAGPDEQPVYVAGSIDRIDEGPDALGVVDYKSLKSKTPQKQLEALLTTEFQLPLYLFAARSSGRARALKAAWLSLRDGEALSIEEVLAEAGQSVEDLLATDVIRLPSENHVIDRVPPDLVAIVNQCPDFAPIERSQRLVNGRG